MTDPLVGSMQRLALGIVAKIGRPMSNPAVISALIDYYMALHVAQTDPSPEHGDDAMLAGNAFLRVLSAQWQQEGLLPGYPWTRKSLRPEGSVNDDR